MAKITATQAAGIEPRIATQAATSPPRAFPFASDDGPTGVSARLVPLSQLRPSAWNPRSIRKERLENLCRAIQADPGFLWRRPVLAQADGSVYAGNQRLAAARALAYEAIPAIVEEVSETLARERALRDNQQWGEWDDEALAQLLTELSGVGAEVELLGFDERTLQQILDGVERLPAPIARDELAPESTERLSMTGDIFQLGEHRILCGDARDREQVARLMDGAKANCLWTDPPYGVAYVGGTRRQLTMENDHAGVLDELLRQAFAAADDVLEAGAAIYVCHPAGRLALTFAERFIAQGWRLHQTLVWVKDQFVLGRSDYHYQHEPILFGYSAGGPGRRGRGGRGWYGDDGQASVFAIARPRASEEHPTMKPVALVAAMLRNSCRRKGLVFDPFLGSGSTLIAAEELGRRCYGIEVEPRYVDVALRRWEGFTGKTAVQIRSSNESPTESAGRR